MRRSLHWLLGSSVQNHGLGDLERSSSPACKHRRVGVESDVVDSIFMLAQRQLHVMEKIFYGRCFYPSPAPRGWLLGCALLSLCLLDQTVQERLTVLHPHRPWPKQVRAHRRKCPLTSTTDHPQAPGETAGMYENGSPAPRAFSKIGSNMEPNPPYRPARDIAALASGALSPLLET